MSAGPIIVIRPEPGNAATVALAKAQGLAADGFPLFRVEPRDWECPDPAGLDGLLVGSANVFRLGGPQLARLCRLPAHVVGSATAQQARQAGFSVATCGEGGLQKVLDHLPGQRLLRLAGEDHIALSCPTGTTITTRLVYAVQPLPLPADLAARLAQGALVLLHSGEAAQHFARQCDAVGIDRARIQLACLGERIAAFAGPGWKSTQIAAERTDRALLALARQMCQNTLSGGSG